MRLAPTNEQTENCLDDSPQGWHSNYDFDRSWCSRHPRTFFRPRAVDSFLPFCIVVPVASPGLPSGQDNTTARTGAAKHGWLGIQTGHLKETGLRVPVSSPAALGEWVRLPDVEVCQRQGKERPRPVRWQDHPSSIASPTSGLAIAPDPTGNSIPFGETGEQ